MGRLRINRQGNAFLQPDEPGSDEVVVSADRLGTALNEDRVAVRRDDHSTHKPHASGRITGSVVRVVTRRRTRIVGTLAATGGAHHVLPDEPCGPRTIRVTAPRGGARPARPGDKVVVELAAADPRATALRGRVVEVLGASDASGVDTLSVLRHYGLPVEFPADVLAEARALGTTVRPRDLLGRTDCRSHPVITIDPADARDFDDAFSLCRDGSVWRLWVHIADVAHYVKPGSALDVEARQRGNSTYLADRVVPMLPEALSNGLCSLLPGVDRLTNCVEFQLTGGRLQQTAIYPAVIRSRRRFTYEEASAALARRPSDAVERMLHDAHELAQLVRKSRFRNGALALDVPETKLRLDARGRVTHIEQVEHDGSHELIEEFMLLANEAVATRLIDLRRLVIHRVHEPPDERRLHDYRANVLRQRVPCGDLRDRSEVVKLLGRLDGTAAGPALRVGFLKSLTRARYAIDPLGHYGLAKSRYTHFTSPIRRYADLMVHRALLGGERGPRHVLGDIADHVSESEHNSSAAERDSRNAKLFAFLAAQMRAGRPTRHPATIADVRDFGFFVHVPALGIGGLVHVSSLTGDHYELDRDRSLLNGRKSGRQFRLGDPVEVEVLTVDPRRRQIDFRLAGQDARSAAPAKGSARVRPAVRRPARV